MNWDGLVAFMHTSDLESTHRFYHEILGLPLYRDQGACRIYRVRTDSYLGFCTHFPKTNPDGIILTLLTDDVDDLYERLCTAPEVQVQEPPKVNSRFAIYHFFVRDPDGYKIEIQKFLD